MKKYNLIIISLILCLTSCGRHSQAWETLQDVETYIEEHADSALSILQEIDSTHLVNKAEKAKYALLLSMAMDKNFIDRTDFDVLQPAIDYYKEKVHPMKNYGHFIIKVVFTKIKEIKTCPCRHLFKQENWKVKLPTL